MGKQAYLLFYQKRVIPVSAKMSIPASPESQEVSTADESGPTRLTVKKIKRQIKKQEEVDKKPQVEKQPDIVMKIDPVAIIEPVVKKPEPVVKKPEILVQPQNIEKTIIT